MPTHLLFALFQLWKGFIIAKKYGEGLSGDECDDDLSLITSESSGH
jgi:hypothetical protein